MNDQLDSGAQVDARAAALESRVIAWRRDLHQHPELSNREVRTAGVVAGHLQALGLRVQTGVAHTGVVGLLDSGRPGPVIALRADMDALPVTEQVDLPFASRTRANFNGQEVGVMHACGHDCHVAILMGVADLLAGMKQQLSGSIKFIFQPAEEGPPPGEEGGAALMIRQGVLENPKPEVIFGLHVFAGVEAGTIAYRPGPAMASSDRIRVTVTGRQTHGALPWRGVDPIVISSQIVLGLQTIVSRQVDVSLEPAVVSIGAIKGGVRDNIIPDTVEMLGTVRTFNEDMRVDIHARICNTVEMIARSAGAAAQVHFDNAYPVTVNDVPLTERMVPTLQRVAGADKVFVGQKITGYEDFSFYQQKIPG
ncbi:MAG TPA: amidohydrolase, partial [Burkholderiales bacterium]|nr:amidohydrolase [Burkholderiales bacterium]